MNEQETLLLLDELKAAQIAYNVAKDSSDHAEKMAENARGERTKAACDLAAARHKFDLAIGLKA